MGKIIDVKAIVEQKKIELKEKIVKLKEKDIVPKLAVILANDEDSSRVYVGKKRKLCAELNIEESEYILDETVTTEAILDIVKKLNSDETVDGILVQLPLYKHLDESLILDSINPKKDVDGFHPLNMGNLFIGQAGIVSCTPKGIMSIIDSVEEKITGKNAVVVGRSRIVGRPISQLLLARGATVTTCHSKTSDLKSHTKTADILVVAVGIAHLITADMVKENAIVIDVGINRVDGKLQGDVDTKNVLEVAKYITPVPGGVGLTTVISLMENLVEVACKRENILKK